MRLDTCRLAKKCGEVPAPFDHIDFCSLPVLRHGTLYSGAHRSFRKPSPRKQSRPLHVVILPRVVTLLTSVITCEEHFLCTPELGVDSTTVDQAVVGALFSDLPVFEHDDEIGVVDGA